jgi:hypothetical protein
MHFLHREVVNIRTPSASVATSHPPIKPPCTRVPPSLPLYTGRTLPLHCSFNCRPGDRILASRRYCKKPLICVCASINVPLFCFLRLLRLLLSDFVCYPLWVLKNGALAVLVLRLQYCDISLLDLATNSSRSYRLGFQEMACSSSCFYSSLTVTVLCYISLDADSSR